MMTIKPCKNKVFVKVYSGGVSLQVKNLSNAALFLITAPIPLFVLAAESTNGTSRRQKPLAISSV